MRPVIRVACLAFSAVLTSSSLATAERLFAYGPSDLGRQALGYFNECDGLTNAGELPSPECMVVQLECRDESMRVTLISVDQGTLAAWLASSVEPLIRSDRESVALHLLEMKENEALGGWIVNLDTRRGEKLTRPSQEWIVDVGNQTFVLPTDGRDRNAVETFLDTCP